METTALYFTAPRQVEVRTESIEPKNPGQVLVQALCSAISAGTELLFYRGEVPGGMAVDASLESLQGPMAYPLKYGYASVGKVVEVGGEADASLLDRTVFSFQPHQSHYWADPQELMLLPQHLAAEQAVFIPNVESAVNFVHDARPALGESILVLGQGIVGLLTTSLLSQFPLAHLITVDHIPLRREWSVSLGATASYDVGRPESIWHSLVGEAPPDDENGFDVTLELSGAPQALNTAIQFTGYDGRIVLGSWYGTKQSPVDFGGKFHRSRIRIRSSQVSSLDPKLTGRWSKSRRMETVLEQIPVISPSRLITHRYPLQQAAQAYEALDRTPEKVLQTVFSYDQPQ